MATAPLTKADLRKAFAEFGSCLDKRFEKIDQRFSETDERGDRKIGGVKVLVEETNARIRALGEGLNLLADKVDEQGHRLDEIDRKIELGYTPLQAHGALEKRVAKLEKARS